MDVGHDENAGVISCSLEGCEASFLGYLALLKTSLLLMYCDLRFLWVCGGGVTLIWFGFLCLFILCFVSSSRIFLSAIELVLGKCMAWKWMQLLVNRAVWARLEDPLAHPEGVGLLTR